VNTAELRELIHTTQFKDFVTWAGAGRRAGFSGPYKLHGFGTQQFKYNGQTVGIWSEGQGYLELPLTPIHVFSTGDK
jgi:hypothetical protein